MDTTILAPAAILVLWSLIMLIWLVATRLPAMAKVGMDLSTAAPISLRARELSCPYFPLQKLWLKLPQIGKVVKCNVMVRWFLTKRLALPKRIICFQPNKPKTVPQI